MTASEFVPEMPGIDPVITRPCRVSVICDLLEEGWPSMDLIADMLVAELNGRHADRYRVRRVRPPMHRRFSAPGATGGRAFTLDRLAARFWDYPRELRGEPGRSDVFHIVDHSYGHLVHGLPSERTVVTCNDLDTFRSVLEPSRERRSAPFRWMTRHILSGFTRARHIACISSAVRDELLAHRLVPPERTSVVPLGVHPSCTPDANPSADSDAARLLGPSGGLELLHVGSTIQRKRIDLLLRMFAAIRRERPTARLVRVGGAMTADQQMLARQLDVDGAVITLPFITRATLAAVYRRAAIVLLPSDAEGFGLPLAEAMACGTPVVASDIPVLREIGGSAAEYASVGRIDQWTAITLRILDERATNPVAWASHREALLRRASLFSWPEYARRMTLIYDALVGG